MKKTVILLGGKISAGKNTTYDLITKHIHNRKAERQYFAQGVKELAGTAFERYVIHLNKTVNEVIDYLNNTDDVVNEPAIDKLRTLLISPDNWHENKTESTRILLQTLGTDIIRNNVGNDYWIKQVYKKIVTSDADVFILTDFRFANEYYDLRDLLNSDWDCDYSIIAVNLVRPIDRNNELIHSHESENDLDQFRSWNFTITNDGDIQHLEEQIINFVKEAEL